MGGAGRCTVSVIESSAVGWRDWSATVRAARPFPGWTLGAPFSLLVKAILISLRGWSVQASAETLNSDAPGIVTNPLESLAVNTASRLSRSDELALWIDDFPACAQRIHSGLKASHRPDNHFS